MTKDKATMSYTKRQQDLLSFFVGL